MSSSFRSIAWIHCKYVSALASALLILGAISWKVRSSCGLEYASINWEKAGSGSPYGPRLVSRVHDPSNKEPFLLHASIEDAGNVLVLYILPESEMLYEVAGAQADTLALIAGGLVAMDSEHAYVMRSLELVFDLRLERKRHICLQCCWGLGKAEKRLYLRLDVGTLMESLS